MKHSNHSCAIQLFFTQAGKEVQNQSTQCHYSISHLVQSRNDRPTIISSSRLLEPGLMGSCPFWFSVILANKCCCCCTGHSFPFHNTVTIVH